MAGINKVILIGNLGADPELRYLPNNDPVANLSLATSERWTDKQTGEQRESVEWHRIIAFRKLAEIIGQYCRKGSKLYIEGKLKTRKWTDNNGIERYTTEIIADQMQMLDSKDDGNRGQNDYGRNNRTQNEYGSNRHDYRDSSGNHYGNRNGPGNRPPARQPDDFADDDIPF